MGGPEGNSARTPRERKATQRYSPSPPGPRGRARQKVDRRLGESQEFLDQLAIRVAPVVEAQEPVQEGEGEEESGKDQEDLDQDWLPEGAAAVVGSLAAAAAQVHNESEERAGRCSAASFFLKERQQQQEEHALLTAGELEGLHDVEDNNNGEEAMVLEGDGVRAGLPELSDSESEESEGDDSDSEDSEAEGDQDGLGGPEEQEHEEVPEDDEVTPPLLEVGSVQGDVETQRSEDASRVAQVANQSPRPKRALFQFEDKDEVLFWRSGEQETAERRETPREAHQEEHTAAHGRHHQVQEEQEALGAESWQQDASREAGQEPTELEQEVQPQNPGPRGEQGEPEVLRPTVPQGATEERWQGGRSAGGGVWRHVAGEEGGQGKGPEAPRPTAASTEGAATGGSWQGGRVGGGGVWQGGGGGDKGRGQGARPGSELQGRRQRQAAQWQANRANPPTCVTEQGNSQLPLILQQVDEHMAANFQQHPILRGEGTRVRGGSGMDSSQGRGRRQERGRVSQVSSQGQRGISLDGQVPGRDTGGST